MSYGAILRRRLADRLPEIEQAVLARVYDIADPTDAADPVYLEGLHTALAAALDYGLAVIESREGRAPPIPTPVFSQARLAARNGISLDTVLRRYLAGYALLGDFLIGAAEDGDRAELKSLLMALAALFDQFIAAVSREYRSEDDRHRRGPLARQREVQVRRLLAGELTDTSTFDYAFDGFHIGLVATGCIAAPALKQAFAGFDCRTLTVRPDADTAWVWIGSRQCLDSAEVERHLARLWPSSGSLSIGEAGEGLAGWRLTHRQAGAGLPVALRGGRQVVRYADVSLLASALQDRLLAQSLHAAFLAPLERERDGGSVAKETLRAFLACEQNASSAAAALGLSRQTVNSRLRGIERRIGQPLGRCVAELKIALELERLGERPEGA